MAHKGVAKAVKKSPARRRPRSISSDSSTPPATRTSEVKTFLDLKKPPAKRRKSELRQPNDGGTPKYVVSDIDMDAVESEDDNSVSDSDVVIHASNTISISTAKYTSVPKCMLALGITEEQKSKEWDPIVARIVKAFQNGEIPHFVTADLSNRPKIVQFAHTLIEEYEQIFERANEADRFEIACGCYFMGRVAWNKKQKSEIKAIVLSDSEPEEVSKWKRPNANPVNDKRRPTTPATTPAKIRQKHAAPGKPAETPASKIKVSKYAIPADSPELDPEQAIQQAQAIVHRAQALNVSRVEPITSKSAGNADSAAVGVINNGRSPGQAQDMGPSVSTPSFPSIQTTPEIHAKDVAGLFAHGDHAEKDDEILVNVQAGDGEAQDRDPRLHSPPDQQPTTSVLQPKAQADGQDASTKVADSSGPIQSAQTTVPKKVKAIVTEIGQEAKASRVSPRIAARDRQALSTGLPAGSKYTPPAISREASKQTPLAPVARPDVVTTSGAFERETEGPESKHPPQMTGDVRPATQQGLGQNRLFDHRITVEAPVSSPPLRDFHRIPHIRQDHLCAEDNDAVLSDVLQGIQAAANLPDTQRTRPLDQAKLYGQDTVGITRGPRSDPASRMHISTQEARLQNLPAPVDGRPVHISTRDPPPDAYYVAAMPQPPRANRVTQPIPARPQTRRQATDAFTKEERRRQRHAERAHPPQPPPTWWTAIQMYAQGTQPYLLPPFLGNVRVDNRGIPVYHAFAPFSHSFPINEANWIISVHRLPDDGILQPGPYTLNQAEMPDHLRFTVHRLCQANDTQDLQDAWATVGRVRMARLVQLSADGGVIKDPRDQFYLALAGSVWMPLRDEAELREGFRMASVERMQRAYIVVRSWAMELHLAMQANVAAAT